MNKPNILMFHRIALNNNVSINKLYKQRGMLYNINDVYAIIDSYLQKGYKFGGIEQSLYDKRKIHLSFDDGFIEHLAVASLLKKRYNLAYNTVSFSINIGNSFLNEYSGMDIIYEIILNNKLDKLKKYIKKEFNENINEIKSFVASLDSDKLKTISKHFSELNCHLSQNFLHSKEVIELSKLFKINSHSMTHRFLTKHKKESKNEILESKIYLEKLINKEVDVFCYPEGKNDNEIQKFCEEAGYKYALSIKHNDNNNFCIGRIIL